MAGKRVTGDLTIRNCVAALTDGDGWRFPAGTTIVITAGRISYVGPDGEAPAPAAGQQVVDAGGSVAMPGLINTHCHAAMNLLRGVAEDVSVSAWFNDYIWPMEVNVGAADVHTGTLLAAIEMIENGITTVADHYFFMDEAAAAFVATGMRANLGAAFFSSQGPEGVEQSAAFAERWHGKEHGRITTALAPHAPYSCGDDDLRAAADAARRIGVRVHTHASETIEQAELSVRDRGKTPIAVLADTGVLDAGALLAHGNGILDGDLPILAGYADRVGVTHGIKGYLKFAMQTLTPIEKLAANGVPVGYCTDGAASNSSLDIFENMGITALTRKFITGDPQTFGAAQALHMAGRGSAAALGERGELGELTVGARGDVILVDVSGAHCQPLHDLTSTLVHCVRSSDVQTTIVDGRVLMRDRELMTIDKQAVLDECRERAAALTDRSHGRTLQAYRT